MSTADTVVPTRFAFWNFTSDSGYWRRRPDKISPGYKKWVRAQRVEAWWVRASRERGHIRSLRLCLSFSWHISGWPRVHHAFHKWACWVRTDASQTTLTLLYLPIANLRLRKFYYDDYDFSLLNLLRVNRSTNYNVFKPLRAKHKYTQSHFVFPCCVTGYLYSCAPGTGPLWGPPYGTSEIRRYFRVWEMSLARRMQQFWSQNSQVAKLLAVAMLKLREPAFPVVEKSKKEGRQKMALSGWFFIRLVIILYVPDHPWLTMLHSAAVIQAQVMWWRFTYCMWGASWNPDALNEYSSPNTVLNS